jgi:hypothetical protein
MSKKRISQSCSEDEIPKVGESYIVALGIITIVSPLPNNRARYRTNYYLHDNEYIWNYKACQLPKVTSLIKELL